MAVTVRIFFGVGGPNYTSSFHVIGEIFDRVYNLGGVLSEPLRGVQTVTVPAGGAVITEFKVDVPGSYMLVDHALSRAERGLAGMLDVGGHPTRKFSTAKSSLEPAIEAGDSAISFFSSISVLPGGADVVRLTASVAV
jgi:nitrite reductase (NO-forming)